MPAIGCSFGVSMLRACASQKICGLRWRDVQKRGDSGQITVYVKEEKTRHVLLSANHGQGSCSCAPWPANTGPY